MNESISTSSITPEPLQPLVRTESWRVPVEYPLCKTYPIVIRYGGEWGQYHQGYGFNEIQYQPFLSVLAAFPPKSGIGHSSSITAEIELVLRMISGLVQMPHPAEIREYLLRFPDMLSILPCICFHTAIEFTTNDQISLELFRDRESEDRYLTLYIRQNTYAKDIMKRLERIWLNFESEIAKSKGWLNITTDFHSPIR